MSDNIYKEDFMHVRLALDAEAREKPAAPVEGLAPPLGESGEIYYCHRDDFLRYIEVEVNPSRSAADLAPLDLRTASECFRILNDFARKWGCAPLNPSPPTGSEVNTRGEEL